MSFTESKMLIMFDTKANSNKFYEAKLDDNGTIHVRYGRVGVTGQTTSYTGGISKFRSLIASKEKKGYKEAMLDVTDAGDGSGQMVKKTNALDIALKQIKFLDDDSKKLIEEIARENIHNITSNTNIKFDNDTGLFKTPLGIVSKLGVEKATDILDRIESLLLDKDKNENELFSLNEEYFVIIPNRVSNARDKHFLIFNQKNLDAQRSICSALLDTLELIEDLKKGKKELDKEAKEAEVEKIFDVEVELLKDSKVFKSIEDYYNKSKNSVHGHRIMNSKIAKIYKVKLGSQQKGFAEAEAEIGNVQQLWHGTRVANLLSIMGKGLLMPKKSPGQKAGAMFGDGLYFANQSSKSLQYCDGLYFASGSNSRAKIYMFLASVAMGKYQVPNGPTGGSGRPKAGYDSFWAKAGKSGVMNDEIIVFKGNQVRLDYLIEIEI